MTHGNASTTSEKKRSLEKSRSKKRSSPRFFFLLEKTHKMRPYLVHGYEREFFNPVADRMDVTFMLAVLVMLAMLKLYKLYKYCITLVCAMKPCRITKFSIQMLFYILCLSDC